MAFMVHIYLVQVNVRNYPVSYRLGYGSVDRPGSSMRRY